jgi:hypothetical protein
LTYYCPFAQAKLTETWKIINIANYPQKWEKKATAEHIRTTRATTAERIIDTGSTNLSTLTCTSDSIKTWNRTPNDIKMQRHLQ